MRYSCLSLRWVLGVLEGIAGNCRWVSQTLDRAGPRACCCEMRVARRACSPGSDLHGAERCPLARSTTSAPSPWGAWFQFLPCCTPSVGRVRARLDWPARGSAEDPELIAALLTPASSLAR